MMTLQLPRLPDTLCTMTSLERWRELTNQAIDKWVLQHFDKQLEWEWVNRINVIFRPVGRRVCYKMVREGKWLCFYRLD